MLRLDVRRAAISLVALLTATLAVASIGCGDDRRDGTSQPPEQAAPLPPLAPLEHLELLTGGADEAPDLPIVVGVHGLGDFPQNFRQYYEGIDVPARVVLPRAPTRAGRGYSWFPVKPFPVRVDRLGPEVAQSADAVVELLGRLATRYPRSPKPIVTGFSQGGMISLAIAVRNPEAIGLAIPMGGALPRSMWPEVGSRSGRLPPVRALHSKVDNIMLIGQTRDIVARLRECGYDATLKEYEGGPHEFVEPMQRDLWRLVADHLTSNLPR